MISKAARSILERLKAAENRDELWEAEVVCEGRTCYLGLDRVSKAQIYELLRLVLISDTTDQGEGLERYELNEEGRAMLAQTDYQPKILKHLAKLGE